jgi:hypothetical protein
MEEDEMEEDVVEDLRFSTNTSNVTHITVIVSTIDLKLLILAGSIIIKTKVLLQT